MMEVTQQMRPLISHQISFPAGVWTAAFFELWVPHYFCSNIISSGSVRKALKYAMVRPLLKILCLTAQLALSNFRCVYKSSKRF